MRGNMDRIQLYCHAKMFYGFFKVPAFLQNLVTETIATKKSFWILGYHQAKCVHVHDRCSRYYSIIALPVLDGPVEMLVGGAGVLTNYGVGVAETGMTVPDVPEG